MMANLHPNTSGLKPLNTRTPEERRKIQSAGGRKTAYIRKKIKTVTLLESKHAIERGLSKKGINLNLLAFDCITKDFINNPTAKKAMAYIRFSNKLERENIHDKERLLKKGVIASDYYYKNLEKYKN